MRKVDVTTGQVVRPGQRIGEAGDLGNATGCHLHFEVHLHNGSIYGPDNTDPTRWLASQAGRPTRREDRSAEVAADHTGQTMDEIVRVDRDLMEIEQVSEYEA